MKIVETGHWGGPFRGDPCQGSRTLGDIGPCQACEKSPSSLLWLVWMPLQAPTSAWLGWEICWGLVRLIMDG